MGNNDSKKRHQDTDEKQLDELFKSISHGKPTIDREELKVCLSILVSKLLKIDKII